MQRGPAIPRSPQTARRHWPTLATRVLRLWLQGDQTTELIRRSYDRLATGYDDTWTHHMRDLTASMLDRLAPPARARCLDLACGTGFVAGELARRTGGRVIGVDGSRGMLEQARRRYGDGCNFIHADIVEYLRSCPRRSFDVITCAWALGYSRPWRVVQEIARVLRPGGRVGIVDNTLFSLAEVLWASVLAFAESPEALTHVMRVWFLPGSGALGAMIRLAGLGVPARDDGSRTYRLADGQAAIERLRATGAAAGFEFACDDRDRERIFARFAEIMEARHGPKGVPITHRWLMAIGVKL